MDRRLLAALGALLMLHCGQSRPARAAVPDRLKPLIEALAPPGRDQFDKAARDLTAAIGEEDVPALVEACKDKRPRVRDGILLAMYKFIMKDRPATEPHPVPVDYVARCLKDESPRVRHRAMHACWWLARHYPKQLAPFISKGFDDHAHCQLEGCPQTIASQAALALTALDTRLRRPLYPKLLKLASEGNAFERYQALQAMAILVEKDPSWSHVFLGRLIRGARPGDGPAIGLLGRFGPLAAPAIPAIRRRLAATSKLGIPQRVYAQSSLVEALINIGPKARSALPEIRIVLDDTPTGKIRPPLPDVNALSRSQAKAKAIRALIALEFPANEVVPLLRRIETNPDEHWSARKAAKAAIAKLTGK